MRPAPHLAALVAVSATLLLPVAARAQHDPAAAESLFRGAKAAEDHGDYKSACPQFAESQRLDPAAGTLLNLADCEEHLGAVASAWGHFIEARDSMPKNDDRIGFAQQRAAALEKRVPHLTVRLPPGAPADAKVMRGNIEIGAASLGIPLAVDPGAITLTVTVTGRATTTRDVTLAEAETRDVVLDVGASGPLPPAPVSAFPESSPPSAPTAATAPAPPTTSSGANTKRTLGWIVGGVGVAGLALGTVTGVMAIGDANTVKANCDSSGNCRSQAGVDAAPDGKTVSLVSTIGVVGGAVATGAGLYLLLTSGPPSSATRVGVSTLPGGGAMSVVGTF
jgi:hypothetical protein